MWSSVYLEHFNQVLASFYCATYLHNQVFYSLLFIESVVDRLPLMTYGLKLSLEFEN